MSCTDLVDHISVPKIWPASRCGCQSFGPTAFDMGNWQTKFLNLSTIRIVVSSLKVETRTKILMSKKLPKIQNNVQVIYTLHNNTSHRKVRKAVRNKQLCGRSHGSLFSRYKSQIQCRATFDIAFYLVHFVVQIDILL
jgi:hypothetical protein